MSVCRRFTALAICLVLLAVPSIAAKKDKVDQKADKNAAKAEPPASPALQAVVDQIFYGEALLVQNMHQYTPLVETYIQNLKRDQELGAVPVGDKYFLGRLVLDERGIGQKNYQNKPGFRTRFLEKLNNFYRMNYVPTGFMQLLFLNNGFDRQNYDLKFERREFLGEVRTLVFDVIPKKHVKGPHFLGRIWVEDQNNNIVRINGTYTPQMRTNYYFHFDSWRLNLRPGLWVPAFVYTEESGENYAFFRHLMMKGQTRLWGYDLKHSGQQQEFTDIQVDAPPGQVNDQTTGAANEISPVGSEHQWHREAEDNVLDRLERAGLLAPAGEVTKVLETVINNLEITNKLNLQPEVRARVLLTTPLESFTIGHTIVISRGMLDVLPDESALAMVLSHELAHIALGQELDTRYAFYDRMLFPDEESLQRIRIAPDSREEQAADQKGMELLKNSPYTDKLQQAGLFLKALQARSHDLSALISPHFGSRLNDTLLRMLTVEQGAPQLKAADPTQIAALPLGSRVKLDPWDDHVELQKTKPVALQSARDKMPFEVTPMIPNLARYREGGTAAPTVAESGATAEAK